MKIRVDFVCRDVAAAELDQVMTIQAAERTGGNAECLSEEPARQARRLRGMLRRRVPFRVAVRGSEVLGYAHAVPYQAGRGYAHCVQDVICVREGDRGRGIGTILLGDFLFACRQARLRQVVAFLLAEDHAGLALHEKLGFVPFGRHRNACLGGGRLHDVLLLRRDLDRLAVVGVVAERDAACACTPALSG